MDYVVLLLAGTATALATGLGAIPVFLIGDRTERFRPAMWGFAGGTMLVAAVIGLLLPALDDGSALIVALGVLVGGAFMLVTRRALRNRKPEVAGLRGSNVSSSVLVFIVLFVHSFPEGLAIGTAYASSTAGLGLFVILAIALQNIPEGTSVALPMEQAGFGRSQQFWAAVATSVPQPIAAVAAFALVDAVSGLLPFSFGFAAGAMLALVLVEFAPKAIAGGDPVGAALGAGLGGGIMLVLSVALGV